MLLTTSRLFGVIVLLLSDRDSGRTEDLDAVLRGQRGEAGDIRRLGRGRRDLAARRGLARGTQERAEVAGLRDEQEARLLGGDDESVRDVPRAVDERAGGRVDHVAADPE